MRQAASVLNMGKYMRIGLIVVVGLAMLLGTALAGASWWIMSQMGPDVWVEQLEKNCDCRAHVGHSELSLLSSPARLRFLDVQIAPRDAEVARPLSDRVPMAEGSAPIVIPEIVFEVKLEDLLNKRLFVQNLRIISPVVREIQDDQGKGTVEKLFRKPKNGEAEQTGANNPPPGPVTAQTQKPTLAKDKQDYAFSAHSASIERGQFTITNKKMQVKISELDLTLSDIDVDTTNLKEHNRVRASLSSLIEVMGEARIGGVKRPVQLANVKLSGESNVIPMDPVTQSWAPTSMLKLTLAQGSVLAGHMTMGDVAGKEMKKLQEYGVDLSPVKIGGALLEPAVMDATFKNNRLTLRKHTRFALPEYEVVLHQSSWLDSAKDQHELELKLSCGASLQTRLQKGIAKAKLGDSLASAVIKALSDESGRMTFDIESKGSLSEPSVRPKIDRLLKNLIRGEGLGDLFKGLLKKL
jgi:hypothetical protein